VALLHQPEGQPDHQFYFNEVFETTHLNGTRYHRGHDRAFTSPTVPWRASKPGDLAIYAAPTSDT
jgi:hypothetical protein